MTMRNKKFANDPKTARKKLKKGKTNQQDELIQLLDQKPEKWKTKIDSTTLIRKDRER